MADVESPNRLIQFPCKCGHRFALPLDMAASVVQCPRCNLLNDVPALSDLANIDDDGTLLLGPSQIKPEPDRLETLNKFYNRSHFDQFGNEKDLRPTFEDLEEVGADLTPIDLKDQGRKAAPKYDPATGELIRPIEVGPQPTKFAAHDEPTPDEIPFAKTSLPYAPARRTFAASAIRIPVELFMPQNVIVLLSVFLAHVINQWAMFAMFGGFFFIVPIVIILSGFIISHYGNCIEDTGPDGKDEVPRPFRQGSFTEDIWRPFFTLTIALFLCYAPAYFILSNAAEKHVALFGASILALIGTIFFPAVAITTNASGSFNNLRPDRLVGVMRAAGWSYVSAVILWLFTAAIYGLALLGTVLFLVRMATPSSAITGLASTKLAHGAFVYPLLMLAILMCHWFCWHIGLIYRWYYDGFPWVLQRHISTRVKHEAERAAAVRARRKKPMYVTPKLTIRPAPDDAQGQ